MKPKSNALSQDTVHLLIKRCLDGDKRAQSKMYSLLSRRMYVLCLRYARDAMEAEDILQEGFIRLFSNLSMFNNNGSFEGWARRVFINTAINYYKSHLRYSNEVDIERDDLTFVTEESVFSGITKRELLNMVQSLPTGYKMVFNLNVIEGYSHKEIGLMLEVSENTSKTQLLRARKSLQKKIQKLYDFDRREPYHLPVWSGYDTARLAV